MPSSSDPPSTSTPSGSGSTLTRRRALAALGATGVGLAVYGTEFYVPAEPEENPPEALGPSHGTPGDVWNATGGGYGNSRHLAVDPITDPTVAWSETVRGAVGAVTAETVYLGRPGPNSDEGRVEARSLDDGSIRWRAAVPGYAGSPSLFGGHVYSTVGTSVRSFDGGDVRWTTDLYATLADAVHEAFLPDSLAAAEGALVAGGREHVAVLTDGTRG